VVVGHLSFVRRAFRVLCSRSEGRQYYRTYRRRLRRAQQTSSLDLRAPGPCASAHAEGLLTSETAQAQAAATVNSFDGAAAYVTRK